MRSEIYNYKQKYKEHDNVLIKNMKYSHPTLEYSAFKSLHTRFAPPHI